MQSGKCVRQHPNGNAHDTYKLLTVLHWYHRSDLCSAGSPDLYNISKASFDGMAATGALSHQRCASLPFSFLNVGACWRVGFRHYNLGQSAGVG